MGKMRWVSKCATYRVVYESNSPKSRRERRMKFLTRTSSPLHTKKNTLGRLVSAVTRNFKVKKYATNR